ncbi:MAG: hypothetical protein KDK90_05795 [Leptospiraceae bacterium]|nr:hypothetical protein [Leptospiraceae bacterium]
MNNTTIEKKAMRDVFLSRILKNMHSRDDIFFLSADFGSPVLDKIRASFPNKFINVGIAEQNLINVATGLALEGFCVFAYAIAPFITMRCYEQVRVNLAILSQVRKLNVNLIGVGAGFSYEVSGPTHHCLEDISLMCLLPNFDVISPSDWSSAEKFVDVALENPKPKYFRFDAKPLNKIYDTMDMSQIKNGFVELNKGQKVCIVATGYMTQKSLEIVDTYKKQNKEIGLIDFFKLKGFEKESLYKSLQHYDTIITIEEGFIGKGGLDNIISNLLRSSNLPTKLIAMGLEDRYIFHIGSREHLHKQNGVDVDSIVQKIESNL